jgi:hypothetical protein
MTKIICDHCGRELGTGDYDEYEIETINDYFDADLCVDCKNELAESMDKLVKEFIGKED